MYRQCYSTHNIQASNMYFLLINSDYETCILSPNSLCKQFSEHSHIYKLFKKRRKKNVLLIPASLSPLVDALAVVSKVLDKVD